MAKFGKSRDNVHKLEPHSKATSLQETVFHTLHLKTYFMSISSQKDFILQKKTKKLNGLEIQLWVKQLTFSKIFKELSS